MRNFLIFSVLLGAAGCSGSANVATDTDAPDHLANTPPAISGMPGNQVIEGQAYSFTPIANDADGDSLTFAIDNKPAWADFDPSSGSLTGEPGPADIGVTEGVTISVTDGQVVAALDPFDLEVLSAALGTATVSWTIPTTSADGGALNDLDGFAVHYGNNPGDYSQILTVNDEASTSAVVTNLSAGSWYFAVTAFDSSGNHSEFSAEVSKVIEP